MLCDEVGLGKTIEACLAMMELITRGLVKRVLILVPPSLIELLSELIIRNRRATSDVKFTKRHARTIQIHMSEPEKIFYESVSNLVKNQYKSSPQQIKMTLRILQEEIGSIPAAASSTLESLKDKLSDKHHA